MKKYISPAIPRIFRIRYPKLLLLIFSIVLAYLIFAYLISPETMLSLNSSGYLGIFVAGLLFSFGFTTPFAVGLFFVINPENVILAALVGGLGALASDILIFNIIKVSFIDEFQQLKKTSSFRTLAYIIKKSLAKKIQIYLLYALAGFIIASPLPDEIGIAMFAGFTTIKIEKLAFISFIMNTVGILIILLIA